MAYDDEIARLQMRPRAELYEIEIGTNERYLLTSYDTDVQFNGETYSARPIQRTEHEQERKVDTDTISVTLPVTAYAVEYIVNGPSDTIRVTITEYFLDTGDFRQKFRGKVLNLTIQGDAAVLDVESGVDSLRNEFPSMTYAPVCQFSTFDSKCGLNKEDFKETGVITLVSPFIIESPALAAQASGYFTHGFLEVAGKIRWITSHAGNQCRIQYPLEELQTGVEVDFFPGDDKKRDTCLNKFNNVARWSGFDKIPLKNQVIDGF